MQKLIRLRAVSWRTFSFKRAADHWVGAASVEARIGLVQLRAFVAHIPIVGLRCVAHEVEHLTRPDFKSNADHHDDPAYKVRSGLENHYCGRGYSFRGFLSLKHLHPDSIATARELIRTGSATVNPEAGSALAEA